MSPDWQGEHFLDGIEVGIVEIAEEPQGSRAENVAENENETGAVEHVEHAEQPVGES